ncbi:MAG: energy transducer TonB [Cyclonatronaceae bacterium]
MSSFTLAAACAGPQSAQEKEEGFDIVIMQPQTNGEGGETFLVTEEMPRMIGGQQRLYDVLEYPPAAVQDRLEGRVIVEYIVNTEGIPEGIEVITTSSGIFNRAAVSALGKMRFTPGLQDGEPVEVQMTQPIIFSL